MLATVYPSFAQGAVEAPPSKSMAHRAIICACLADGESVIRRVAASDDVNATIGAMEALGAVISRTGDTLKIRGTGGVPRLSGCEIDCAESGSTLRFLIPLFSLAGCPVVYRGRGRLMERPQDVYASLFEKQGARFFQKEGALFQEGALKGGRLTVRGDVSSQFVTGLLLALPLLKEDSVIEIQPPFESRPYVLLTLQVLRDFGVNAWFEGRDTLVIPGGQRYQSTAYTVEGDYSQLAFFAVRGAIGAKTACRGVRPDSMQGDRAICSILRTAGACVEISDGGVTVSPGELCGKDIDLADCPDLGPVLMAFAAFCEGETRILHAGRLRMKESDRIAAMEAELKKLGVRIASTADTVTVSGRKPMEKPVTVCGHGDHRIAMSLAVFASAAEQPVCIKGAECVNKSYPDFFEALRRAGVRVECEAV